MKKKIMRMMLLVSSLLLILFGAITWYVFGRVHHIVAESSERSSQDVEKYSDVAMRDQITGRLSATTLGCAYSLNKMLDDFSGTIQIIADSATDIYTNPDVYGRTYVKPLEKSDIGKSMGQFVYAEDVDPDDPAVQDELAMIGNLKGNLLSMYNRYPELGASYIGTESGIMLLAGPVLDDRWDENGDYVYLDPRLRPWYYMTKESKKLTFSEITPDYDTGRLAIMCGAPIFRGKEFVGVAGAGLYLEGIESMMMNAIFSDAGNTCIIDGKGNIIFSSNEEGELKTQTVLGGKENSDKALAMLTQRAIEGQSGLELLDIDGESSYVAFSPIESVGWSLISIIPEKTVLAPKENLLTFIEQSHQSEANDVEKTMRSALIVMFLLILALAAFSVFISNKLSKRLVMPIALLTDKVRNMDGDQLNFAWYENTDDEVETLAHSFGSMTERLKEYIDDIQTVTAEKERIHTELSLATRIQAGIMPHDFPAFPDKKEFDLYALMEPAREVGGDFYDYFLIDDDHLGMVMADVSGKGIPAALFMMVSKTILQSCAMLGKSAAETLNLTNEALTSNNQTGMFVTVWFGILEISSGKLTCANAGHEYPAVKRADGSFELYKDKHGFVIGGMEGTKYQEYTIQLDHGDMVFLYTDGVPEATNSDVVMYGTDRMLAALNKEKDSSLKELLDNVCYDITDFIMDAEQFDDLTMMCLKYN
ncbi:MAG: HAMP domain-containing protein [Butyrivibrio sp.]|nr:HAMP domain-containing protein [Butyrivibrio sp.]